MCHKWAEGLNQAHTSPWSDFIAPTPASSYLINISKSQVQQLNWLLFENLTYVAQMNKMLAFIALMTSWLSVVW